MKATGLFLLLLLAMPAWAANTNSTHAVDCGANKAVPFDEAVSPDGRYAIGWTIIPKNKKVKPVDWSLWDKDDPQKIINSYISDPAYQDGKDDYTFTDCVIDIQGKSLLALPSDEVDYPQKNRGYLVAAWSKPVNGKRYALVENDARFNTANLWLITIDSTGMHVNDVAGVVDKAVQTVLREKRPLTFGSYETVYPLNNESDPTEKKASFTDSIVTFAFDAEVPKSDDETESISGVVTLRLVDGTVIKATSDDKRDDPFQDLPALAAADKQLNDVYQKLSLKLDPTQRAALKKDQLDWIQTRDDESEKALRESLDNSNAHDPHKDRDKSLLDSTRQRVKDLQDRLNGLH